MMNKFINNLWLNQRLLVLSAFGFLLVTIILAGLMIFDSTQILGINRWIKPVKFSISAAIFLFTTAVYLYYLKDFAFSKLIIARGTSLIMIAEVSLVIMQAARGTTSHFNVSTAFDGIVYAAMGLMIVTNTLLIVFLAILYFRANFDLPSAVVWGMRLGLLLFLIGSIQGGYMSTQIGHSVGAADGGAGLPFLSWSTVAGDLRVAHFLGLHAFQAIPLFALALVYLNEKISFIKPMTFTVIFAALYFSAFTLLFAQALLGKPLVGKHILTNKINNEVINAKSY
jgi:hypothetical protein